MDDFEKIGPILKAFVRMAEDPATYRKSLDEVDDEFTQALSKEVAKDRRSPRRLAAHARSIGTALIGAIRPPKTSAELLEFIQQRCELTDRQVKLLTDTGLIVSDQMGRPVLRQAAEVLLAPERAAIYLFLLGILFGATISSILFATEAGVLLIGWSLSVGVTIGSLGGLVLRHSFRAYPLLEKLKDLQPWFQERSGPSI